MTDKLSIMHCLIKEIMWIYWIGCEFLFCWSLHRTCGIWWQPNAEVNCYPLDQCRGWMCQISVHIVWGRFSSTDSLFFLLLFSNARGDIVSVVKKNQNPNKFIQYCWKLVFNFKRLHLVQYHSQLLADSCVIFVRVEWNSFESKWIRFHWPSATLYLSIGLSFNHGYLMHEIKLNCYFKSFLVEKKT